jgi:hypothetical protein
MSVAVAQVRKRDGGIVPFDRERLANAIFKAARAVDHDDRGGFLRLGLISSSRLR